MIEIRFASVTKRFGDVTAVSQFDLEAERGEFITLLGPSGCGKTTTLRLLAGFLPPSAGIIEIGGRTVSDIEKKVFVPPGRRKIGMVFQDYALWPHMNVFANTSYPLKIEGIPLAERRKRTEEILAIVKMPGMEERFPHELSGGQQQRVAVARALIANPKVLLLDEPLSNLDAALRESMRLEIKSLHQRLGVTILFVTHDQYEAMSLSDRIVVMESGSIRQVGTPQELYDSPADPFVASFVGKANFFKASLASREKGKVRLLAGDSQIALDAGQVSGELRQGLGCAKPTDIELLKPGGKGIPCRIRDSLFVGDSVLYYVQIGPLELEVRSPSRDFASLPEAALHFRKVILF